MRTTGDGRWLRGPRLGSAVLVCVLSALLWLVIAPAAGADSTVGGPQLTDSTMGSADYLSTSNAALGDTLTLTQGIYLTDLTDTGVQDSWYDCPTADPATPNGCTVISTPAGTPLVYTVGSDDQGTHITVFETDPVAGVTTPVVASVVVPAAPTAPPPPTNSAWPSIMGLAVSGSTLTAVPGTWSGASSYSYSWAHCNSSGGGTCPQQGTGPTLQLTTDDVGGYIVLTEYATATNSSDLSATSSATSVPLGPITTPALIVPPPDPPAAGTAVPTITGTAQIGATLIAAGVAMSNSPTYTYQWLRCGQSCTAIPGATGTTYSPSAADLGDTLTFSETGTNAGGGGHAQSAKTAGVTAPTETTLQVSPANVTAGQMALLIATVTSATGQAPPMGAITFEQAGTAIPGCASVTTHPTGASATVTCQAAFTGSSSTLSAAFTPTPGSQVTGSDSTAVGFLLGRAATAATMTVPAHVTLGKRLELTAKIVPQAGTTGVSPTGDVVFLDGKKAIKGCEPALSHGVAHCVVSYRALGTHLISAAYLGDGNFSGSSTQVHSLGVVVAKPTGYVSSLMTWTFRFEPRYTRVVTLTVTGVQPGLTISVKCSGSGCPKHPYVDAVTRAACGKPDTCKNVNLARRFAGRRLGVGARLTVRLSHDGWLGKYYSFVVRHGRKPKIETACLAVGQAKPGVGCTPQ